VLTLGPPDLSSSGDPFGTTQGASMSAAAQEPSAHLPAQPAGAPQIPGARGAQAATEANRAAVRAAFGAWQAGTGTITSLFAADMR